MAGRVVGTLGVSSALASYNSSVRDALSFFRRSKIEVELLRRESQTVPNDMDREHPSRGMFQALKLKAVNSDIDKLSVKVWIDGGLPKYLAWLTPLQIFRHPTAHPSQYNDLVEDEETMVVVWSVLKTGEKTTLTINTTDYPSTEYDLNDIGPRIQNLHEKQISLNLQFIGKGLKDRKVHKFKLNVRSWDDLLLTKSE